MAGNPTQAGREVGLEVKAIMNDQCFINLAYTDSKIQCKRNVEGLQLKKQVETWGEQHMMKTCVLRELPPYLALCVFLSGCFLIIAFHKKAVSNLAC